MPARVANEYLAVGGLITDISLGGCRMVLDAHSPEKVLNIMRGDELALTLPTDADETCQLEATVQNHREVKGYRSLGLSFLRDADKGDTVLARFVERMEGARLVLEQDG
jgi:c-di-GMP-binding flagellar brake protein YcgR